MTAGVALTSWRTPGDDVLTSVRFTSEVGADGLQVDLGGSGRGERLDVPRKAQRVRTAADVAGVTLTALGLSAMDDVGLAAPTGTLTATRVQSLLARQRETAIALGVDLTFVPSFRRSAIEDDETLSRTADVLAEAADLAAREGLVLASENALGAEGARRLVRRVSHPAFRLLFDTGNPPSVGVDPVELVRRIGSSCTNQVHVKDPAGPPTAALDAEQERAVGAAADHIPGVRWWVGENDLRRGRRAAGLAEVARLRGIGTAPSASRYRCRAA